METFHLYLLQKMLKDPRVDQTLPTARNCVQRALASGLTDFWHVDLSAANPQQANLAINHSFRQSEQMSQTRDGQ